MQLYRVILLQGHTAAKNQNLGGYLGDTSYDDKPLIYKRGEALKKARMFGGRIEPFGQNYNIDELKVLRLSRACISVAILKELDGREVFTDTDNRANESDERLFDASIFEAILGENHEKTILNAKTFTDDILNELEILSVLLGGYDYLMLTPE